MFPLHLRVPKQMESSEETVLAPWSWSELSWASGFSGEIRTHIAKDGLAGFVNVAKQLASRSSQEQS